MKPKIVVIGSSNTDMICRVPHIPSLGETVLGSDFLTIQGGKGANQAVAAARAGGEVTFIGCVGNDVFGKQALASYQVEGIDISCMEIIDGVPTGIALINVADSGENSISVAPGANARLLPEVIDMHMAVILGADYILMQLEIPIASVYHAVRLAHQAAIPVVLNPAPACELDPAILSMITLLTPNVHEASALAGFMPDSMPEADMAHAIRDKGVKSVVITTGARGAYILSDTTGEQIAGMEVRAVDTTAAGDTFNGYLVTRLAEGYALKEAVAFANIAAALSVTRLGAQPSIPYLREVQDI